MASFRRQGQTTLPLTDGRWRAIKRRRLTWFLRRRND